MVAAILLTVSMAALCQFWLYYWRAMILGVAAQPVSDRVRIAAGITASDISARDFQSILSLHDLSPDLRGSSGGFRAVRAYYSAMKGLSSMVPAMAKWANREMEICTRYAAVLIDQHLERNMACAAQMRGM